MHYDNEDVWELNKQKICTFILRKCKDTPWFFANFCSDYCDSISRNLSNLNCLPCQLRFIYKYVTLWVDPFLTPNNVKIYTAFLIT